MKTLFLTSVLLLGLISVHAQIIMTSDSMIVSKLNDTKETFIPLKKTAENFSLEIDKDLLTLRIYGTGHEHAVIERAYIIELSQVDDNKEKWEFQGVDKNCVSYTITIDMVKKALNLTTFGREQSDNKVLTMTSFPLTEIKINKEAITAHLKEKGNYKY